MRHHGSVNDLHPQTVAAVEVVEEALRLAAAGTGAVHAKHGRDVVTETDIAVEDLIREALSSQFGSPVIGEERGGEIRAAEPYWLVDPICGTRNYESGIPLYAVNVALVEDGDVSAAVVGDGCTGRSRRPSSGAVHGTSGRTNSDSSRAMPVQPSISRHGRVPHRHVSSRRAAPAR